MLPTRAANGPNYSLREFSFAKPSLRWAALLREAMARLDCSWFSEVFVFELPMAETQDNPEALIFNQKKLEASVQGGTVQTAKR